MSSLDSIPQHVAIVMDGNGRWANKRLLPRAAGHKEGVKAVKNIIEASAAVGIKYLTLFAFSSENWNRPKTEVSALMDLFVSSLDKEVSNLDKNGIRIQFIGDREQFGQKLQEKIKQAEQITAKNEKFYLNIAANYGGRWDIVQACKAICEKVQSQSMGIESIDEKEFALHLSTNHMPDPDLLIRTAGELRISNFLIWQLAYTEFYVTDLCWPDFDEKQLHIALKEYAKRKRKFGRTQEQIESNA